MIMALDQEGVYVSSGSACASLSTEPSHVLTAMGLSRDLVRSALRFSLSRFTTEEEIDYALSVLVPIVKRLRSISPIYE
jgi:cysteine desulfurase